MCYQKVSDITTDFLELIFSLLIKLLYILFLLIKAKVIERIKYQFWSKFFSLNDSLKRSLVIYILKQSTMLYLTVYNTPHLMFTLVHFKLSFCFAFL